MTLPTAAATDFPAPLKLLAQLVVKQGVGLGGLPLPQQDTALVWVWAGLPEGEFTEPGFNAVLKAQLRGPAAFLQTDHVELRRWLVDKQLVQRDGFGRAYQRVPLQTLPDALRSLGVVVHGLDTARWAGARREAHEAARAARRSAWEARSAGTLPEAPR